MRILFGYNLVMIGPEANHFMLVSGRDNFAWRSGQMGDLLPLIGDGLLTTDGDYHDAAAGDHDARLPPRAGRAAARAMGEEAAACRRRRSAAGEDARRLRLDTRPGDADRDAGAVRLRPRSRPGPEIAARFESGLSFHGREYPMQLLVGPGTPLARPAARPARRSRTSSATRSRPAARAATREGDDILGSLLAATDEEGNSLSDGQVLDHVLTLLFAGHDTTTSTVSFLIYELARNPEWADRLRAELDDVCGDREPTPRSSSAGCRCSRGRSTRPCACTRRPGSARAASVRDFEFAGVPVAGRAPGHLQLLGQPSAPGRLRGPDRFDPDRFLPERRAHWPRGAYVPFGMGPRVCIGKRFGYTEVHAIAAALLRRFRFELPDGHELEIQQAPTLSPRGGLPVRLLPR